MGWAQIHISTKGKELSMTFEGGEEAAEERWAMEREAMEEFDRAAYEERPRERITERIPIKRPRVRELDLYGEEVEALPSFDEMLIEDLELEEAQNRRRVYNGRNGENEDFIPRTRIRSTREEKIRYATLPDKYYLGRKLRPVDLGVDL